MKKRAFTLMEALTTLTLFLLVMTVSGNLLQSLNDQHHWSGKKSQAFDAGEVALRQIEADARAAYSIVNPAPASTTPANRLDLIRIDPNQTSTLLPNPLPPTLGTSWNPDDPTCSISLNVTLTGNKLRRQCGTIVTVLAVDLVGFQIQNQGTNQLSVVLTVLDGQIQSNLHRVFGLPLEGGL